MLIQRNKFPILIINLIFIAIFSIIFLKKQNHEFLFYIGVILTFLILIIKTNKIIQYPNRLLWGLTIWSIMHMIGGGIQINNQSVYEKIIINLIGEPYNVLKYDQIVHILGIAVATLLLYHIIKPAIKIKSKRFISINIIIIMAGMGVGALNEVVEFIISVLIRENGVGGYENNSLDLIANLIGACVATFLINKDLKKKIKENSR